MKKIPELRQPAIAGLVDGTLDPGSVPNGAQVSVFYDDMMRDDQVEVRWLTSSPAASFVQTQTVQADGVPLNLVVPYAVLDAGRGLTATVGYTSLRNGAIRESYAQTVAIRDGALPTPTILEAAGGTLDLNVVTGDVTAHVAPYPRMAAGQTFWLRLHGLRDDGEAWSGRFEGPLTVQPGEVQTGVRRTLKRPDLLRLENNSGLGLEMKAELAGGADESEAVVFPEGVYVMTQVMLVLPAPSVEGVVEGYLDPESIPAQGVKITAAFPGQVAGYWVGAHWVGIDDASSHYFPAQEVTGASALEFQVPKAIALLSDKKPVTVEYKIARITGGLGQTSLPTPLILSADSPTVPLPGSEDFELFAVRTYTEVEFSGFLIKADHGAFEVRIAPSAHYPAIINKALYFNKAGNWTEIIRITPPQPLSEFRFGVANGSKQINITAVYAAGNSTSFYTSGMTTISQSSATPGGKISSLIIVYENDAPPIYVDNISWKF